MSEKRSFGFFDTLFPVDEKLKQRHRVDGVVSSAYVAIDDTIRFSLKQMQDEQIVASTDFEARIKRLTFHNGKVTYLNLDYEQASTKLLKSILAFTPLAFLIGGGEDVRNLDVRNLFWISVSEPNSRIPIHAIADDSL